MRGGSGCDAPLRLTPPGEPDTLDGAAWREPVMLMVVSWVGKYWKLVLKAKPESAGVLGVL